MTRFIHPVAGTLALATICGFWIATVVSELFASAATVTAVKQAIPWGLLLLVPALAAAGGTGARLGRKMRGSLIVAKTSRMPVIAANGLLILVPSALYLSAKAQAGAFDTGFYLVQAVELVAGAVNILLLGLNMRDGIRLSGRRRRAASPG